MAYIVQSVILRKPIGLAEARKWLMDHGYSHKKVDSTHHFYRFRQHDPVPLEKAGFRFRSIPIGEMGDLIVAYPPRHG